MSLTMSHPLLVLSLALVAAVLFAGVALGKRHDPVAVEPDAKRPKGVEVATFALG